MARKNGNHLMGWDRRVGGVGLGWLLNRITLLFVRL